MSEITKFDYEGHPIIFEFQDGNRMINATQMAKPFKKLVADFLRQKTTKEYVALLQKRYVNSHIAPEREVLRVVKGGDASAGLQGTWMDEKLALKFASWLSAEFELWVYDRVEELLRTGKTEIKEHRPAQNIIKSIRLIADQMEAHEMEIQKNREDIEMIKDFVGELNAKIISIDENYYAVSGYCSLHNIYCPVDKARKWGYAATKLSNQKNVPTGKAFDEKYGQINTYHMDILKEVIKAD